MKKFTFLFFASILLLNFKPVFAQNLIAVQNSGTPSFFTKLEDAIQNAQTGDTIYIPGGSYSNIPISKELHLIGVGHHPDSTIVTGKTVIQPIVLNNGASSSSITGIYTSLIQVNDYISNVTISRSYVGQIKQSSGAASFFTINENIIGGISLSGSNHLIENNIMLNGGAVFQNSSLKNNIFTMSWVNYSCVLGFHTCILENNIFPTGGFYMGYFNSYRNNLNGGINGINTEYTTQGKSNFLDGTALESVFINYDPTKDIYNADFHLKSDSPYKNAGTDGTDIGIYGGAFPWKDGSIPANPHYQRGQIAPKTDNNGNLNVKIKVAAQDN